MGEDGGQKKEMEQKRHIQYIINESGSLEISKKKNVKSAVEKFTMAFFPPGFDWRHYIGHFVGAFVIACYGAIFFYIYRDGAYDREMQARGIAAAKDPKNLMKSARKVVDSIDLNEDSHEKDD